MIVRRSRKATAQQRKADNDLNSAKRIANDEVANHWFLGVVYPKDKEAVQHLIGVMETYVKQRQQGVACLLGSRIGEVIKTKETLQQRLNKLKGF
jgi:hypothetical protein